MYVLTLLLQSVDNKLVLIGGINRGNTHLNEVHVYDPRISEQGAWYQPAVSGTFQPRGFHTVSHWNSETNTHKLVVFGGSSSYNAATMSSSVYFNDVNLITLKYVLLFALLDLIEQFLIISLFRLE